MARLDARLDDEGRRRLDEIVEERGRPISEVVRGLIGDAYEAVMQERRRTAARRLAALEVEAPPDPAELSRELEAAHEPGGLPLTPTYPSMRPAGSTGTRIPAAIF